MIAAEDCHNEWAGGSRENTRDMYLTIRRLIYIYIYIN